MKYLLILTTLLYFSDWDKKFSKAELTGQSSDHLIGKTYKLQAVVMDSIKSMRKAALKDGINIQVASAFRSFDRQKSIWNRKYKRYRNQGLSPEKSIEKIVRFSTIPGTSRHHWGTDFDIIDGNKKTPSNPLNEVHFNSGGRYHKMKQWMDANSEKYGFYLVYTNNPDRQGFEYEPWHYTFKPISVEMLKEYNEMIDLKEFLSSKKISGHEHLTDDFLNNYYNCNIMDINPILLPEE